MQSDPKKIQAKLRLISQYIKKGKYSLALKLLVQLDLVQKNPLHTLDYLHYKGQLALKRGLGLEAETCFQQAQTIAKSQGRSAILQNKKDFVDYYLTLRDQKNSETLLQELLQEYASQEDFLSKSLLLLQFATLRIQQEAYEEASECLAKAQSDIIQEAPKYEMVRYYEYMAHLSILWQRGDPEDYLDLALVVARERQFREQIAHLLLLKGKAGLLKRGNTFESMGYLEGALFYIQELELHPLYPEVYYEMALLYENFEDLSRMETYLNLAHQALLKNAKNYPLEARPLYLASPLRHKLENDLKRCQNMLQLEQKTEKKEQEIGADSLDDFLLIDARLFDSSAFPSASVESSQAFLSQINVEVSKHPSEQNYEDLLKIMLINQKLNQESDQKKLMEFILDMMIDVSQAERGFLVLSSKGKFVIKVARNIDREELKKPEMKVSQTILQQMFRTGKEVILDNAMEADGFKGNKSVYLQKLRSVLCVPLAIKNRVVGGVYLDNRFVPGMFKKQTIFHVTLLATQAAIALENSKLYRELQLRQLKLESYTKEIKKLNQQLKGQIQIQQHELLEVKQKLSLHQEALETKYSYQDIVATSGKMQQLLKALDKIVESHLSVLIQGESGTGKELIAKAIHYNGPQKKANFVSINCAALPEPLLESELFGHKRGAFTGATEDKKGLFELAGEGTLFLDEIGDMPLTMQTKILRVLQEGEVRPIGGKEIVAMRARIVAATHHHLQDRIKLGKFREDLYYRICVIEIKVPPLRERLEDVPALVEHFLEEEAKREQQKRKEIDPSILNTLLHYSWPGNIRELRNEVQRWHAMVTDQKISLHHLSERVRQNLTKSRILSQNQSFKEMIEAYEREIISQKMEETTQNKSRAAKELGLSRDGLRKILIRLGLEGISKSD